MSKENDHKKKVLFLCTGNSCRSQLAEAIVNARMNNKWRAYSAGTRPTGFVHPKTIHVLEEIGINHDGRSKSVDIFRQEKFDLIITVCDPAAEECPIWLGPGLRVHKGFPDPAKASGDEEETLSIFREVRDDIREEISGLLKEYE